MRNSLKVAGILLALVACGAGQCTDGTPMSANKEEANVQDRGLQQVHRNQPAPTIAWSFDRQVVISMFLARQQGVATYSVVYDQYAPAGSRIEFACPSLGYPVPYATQITNPHRIEKVGVGINQEPGTPHTEAAVIDQAEPNGLFPPASAEATWVPCVGEGGQLQPEYIEDHVETFAYPVQEDSHGRLVRVPGSKSSVNIDASH